MSQCTLCGEINYSGDQIKDLARALIRLQRQIQPVIESYEKGRRSHPRCHWCYTDLHKSRQSVPQRRKIAIQVDEMLKGEDEETADTDIDSIMRAIHNELAVFGSSSTHRRPEPGAIDPVEDIDPEDDDTER